MNCAPIALFVYNRLWHTQRTVESLLLNIGASESDLFVFSDGPKPGNEKQVAEVRAFIAGIKGFRSVEIFNSDQNKGLAKSIIGGVSAVLEKHENVIVVEDDLETSRYFLDYMNQALAMYAQDERVISIHGYIYPVKKNLPETFFLKGADCWGWATWKRGWALFNPDGKSLLRELEGRGQIQEFDFGGAYPYSRMLKDQIAGRNDSWAIRWYASAFLKEKLTMYPGKSLVHNIGNDLSGTHSGRSNRWDTEISSRQVFLQRIPLREDKEVKLVIARYFKESAPTLIGKVINKLISLITAIRKK